MFDEEEYERWIRQAEYTLKSAEKDAETRDFSWACFKAQQAAEFAVKELLYGLGIMAYGHSLKKLLEHLSQRVEVPAEIQRCAVVLDRYYIQTRYPDAYYEGAPYEFYEIEDAGEALESSKKMIEFVRGVANEALRG